MNPPEQSHRGQKHDGRRRTSRGARRRRRFARHSDRDERAFGDGGRREDYLKKQSRLADLQIETLEKQDEFEVSHLRWRRVRDQMTGVLQFVAVAFGVALVAMIVLAVDASRDNGLVIEAFSVPSDFSSR